LGFHTVTVVGRLVPKLERDSSKDETIHITIQKQRIHNKTKIQTKRKLKKEY
jgi:hypothetical protein